jgi:hypothetical protein
MAALLAAALQRLAASRGPHTNTESMRLSPTPSVRLICAFQISLLPTLNLLIGSDRYNNLAADSSQGAWIDGWNLVGNLVDSLRAAVQSQRP